MTFWVVKVVRVVKGACLSEERRVKSEKFYTLVDYCYLEFKELESNVLLGIIYYWVFGFLMCRLICNLPELSIRILIRSLPIFD